MKDDSAGLRAERGAATVEFVWLSILLLVPLVYVLIAFFDAQRAAYGTSVASQSAARAFIQAPDVATAVQRAEAAAALAMRDQRVGATDVRISCLPSTADCLTPGSSVRVRIETTQRLPLTPAIFGDDVGAITVDSTHTQPYGTYRQER